MATKEIETAEIGLKNAQDFANELWSKIVDERLFSYQKSDICDYLLYLFNAHSKDKFLDTNTNEQNERLLKMNASKIKASKKNIAVKFMNDGEYKGIFEKFLLDLSKGVIVLRQSDKNDCLEFVLENKVTRDILNAKLKSSVSDVFNYPSINTEKVEISAENFVKMLKKEAEISGKTKEFNEITKQFSYEGQKLNFENLAAFVKGVCGEVLNECIRQFTARALTVLFFN